MKAFALALLLAAPTLAGCLSKSSLVSAPETSTLGVPDLPPGCDPARPAAAHRAGGVPVPAAGHAVALPCLARIGLPTLEPTIGLTKDGAVFTHKSVGAPRGVIRSSDQGATWDLRVPSIGGVATHVDSSDPFLYVDPATSRVFLDDLVTPNCSILSWTDDGGTTWGHSLAGCMETDHQHIFAGPPKTSATTGYPNVVYRCAINGGVGASLAATCQRSLDGGNLWRPPGQPVFVVDPTRAERPGLPCASQTGNLGDGTVASNGRVYVAKGWCDEPWLAWSDDEGGSWARVRVSDREVIRTSSEAFGFHSDGFPGDEASVATDRQGNVYYAWVARDRLPYLAISRDGGRTWGDPFMVGAPGLKESNLPALAVGGPGRVVISYLGSTNAPGAPYAEVDCRARPTDCVGTRAKPGYENVTWNGYLTMGLDVLSDAPTFLSVSANDPTNPLWVGRCGVRCGPQFDFLDVAIGPDGTPWAPFIDGCPDVGCVADSGLPPEFGHVVVGRLWGGPSLWDEEDPNGPYP